ncbi:hypothetical protein [Microterricola viridarii]|uniref:Uncharacterized protein n=1 Tax=Microterricola viridarii TaxID=412690 RepID=A0A1H1SYD3_9MICO|nr:hypothetical protein [Microterricola viridarii]SDS53015.1 hypothetical protein SAMN04489834_1650 [Microterricola viridarii]
MSTRVVADPIEFAAKLNKALAFENQQWSHFPLWGDVLIGRPDYHLHRMLSGISALVAGEVISYVASDLHPSEDRDNCNYSVTVFTGRHVVLAQRAAGEDWPTITLMRRRDLLSIALENAPITTISVLDHGPDRGNLTVKLGYPSIGISLAPDRHYEGHLANFLPSLMADLDA